MASARRSVAFLHPDLGIGGAERLVVDAALAVKAGGHLVHIFTSHHDRSHCFEETRDGTVLVTVYGDWLPRSICGYAMALCAYIRMLYLAIAVMLFEPAVDTMVVDQCSICVSP